MMFLVLVSPFLLFKAYGTSWKVIYASIFAAHSWLRDENLAVPLDILIYKLVKSYVRATPLKRAALKVFLECYLILNFPAYS